MILLDLNRGSDFTIEPTYPNEEEEMSMKERYERGLELLRQVDGDGGVQVVDSLKDLAPDVGRYIIEFAFGDIYARGGLSLRDRELATIASLCTQGACEPQLKVHIRGALNAGMTEEQILESFIQLIPYVGFPRVLNAITVARAVMSADGGTNCLND